MKNNALIKTFNGGFIDKNDFIGCLKKLGIKSGDTLCVHTELLSLGVICSSKNYFLQSLTDGFFDVIGESGTLIMPTFTYSFCKNENYDINQSKSTMGVLTEYFRNLKYVKRTNDPIFSFAIKGAKENLFLNDTNSCFGADSVYDILTKENGKIILLGTDKLGYTFTHYTEEYAFNSGYDLRYRYFKEFSGQIIKDDAMSKKTILYFVRDLKQNSILSVDKQVNILKKYNNFKYEKFANSCIVCIDAALYLRANLCELEKDLGCLVC